VTRAARERTARNARRRWLILFAAVVLVVAAILANITPLTHFQDASARLGKATAKADTLEEQKAQLQSQLARLSETSYLETLARQQLTYVRPGEDLYIVTETPGGATDGAGAAGTTAALNAPGLGAGMAGQDTGQGGDQAPADRPGFFERVISAIRSLF
jgi:cell division protein FtsB